jgi:asparagine synthase (glutamine-hydrolysing)
MCGICGMFNLNGRAADSAKTVRAMADAIRHRGPDDDGFHDDESVSLGMRRLSIIDVAGGRQPVSNEDKSLCTVFNGEIYNYRELRAELESQGHRFSTNSDTEVLVHLYEQHGESFLNRLNGMFAFAIWDRPRRKLFLARDRFGKKPLYYAATGSFFAFGSELKCLLSLKELTRDLDFHALSKYLLFEYVPVPQTMFKAVKKLPPAHAMTVSADGRVEMRRYWDFDIPAGTREPDPQAAVKRLDELLADAVKIRLMSEVPLGVFLSGGIDSSTIAWYMTQFMPASRVKTFSIGFEEKSFDESAHARRVARFLGTDHHEEVLDAGRAVKMVPEVASFLDEPFADASIVPTYLLSKFTRTGVTVALGGDGSDELFAGYPTFQAHRLARIYDAAPVVLKQIAAAAGARLPVSFENISLDFKVKQFLRGGPFPAKFRHQVWLGTFTKAEQAELLADDVSREADVDIFEDIESSLAGRNFRDELDLVSFLYMRFYLVDDILFKVDRASMAASLEVRAPFLDYRVVEFVSKLPAALKLRGLTTKHLLKKLMGARLPRGIASRAKKGFGMES